MAHLDSYDVDVSLSTDMGSLTAVGVYDVDVQPKEKSKCCIKRSPLGQRTGGLIRQVTS
jgi:hypothetical protein